MRTVHREAKRTHSSRRRCLTLGSMHGGGQWWKVREPHSGLLGPQPVGCQAGQDPILREPLGWACHLSWAVTAL